MTRIHTPGPWAAEAAMSSDIPNIRYITADGLIIASVRHRKEHSQAEALSNAQLMAQAPAMSEIFREVVVRGRASPDCIAAMAGILDKIDGLASGAQQSSDNATAGHRSCFISSIKRKGWEPRLAAFDTAEDMRADALDYARDVVGLDELADDADIEEIAAALNEEANEELHWQQALTLADQ